MPQPIDVGSILGGRYKVTGRILASAENDVVLDGLDQVLNRPVSILTSAPANSGNLTGSAREVATGGRVSNVSILDLGVQDGTTYLIASRATPADLLDLLIPTEPEDDGVYREPFFTDTLGAEIFGSARDAAPAAGGYVYEDNTPVTPAHPAQPVRPAPTAAVPAAPAPGPAVVPAPAPAAEPRVTLWDDDDYDDTDYEDAGDGGGGAATETEERPSPRSNGRLLTGVIVGVLVVAALVFALSHIGSLFNGATTADSPKKTTAEASQSATGANPPSEKPAQAVVAPVVAGLSDITSYGAGVQHYGDMFKPRLKEAIDGNKGTYWPTVEFSSADFANLIDSVDLAVELKQVSTVSSVSISQIAGTGGQFNVLTNDRPSLDGAKKVGSGSFTGPDFTLKVPDGVQAKYVILNFTQAPKLQPYTTYPYGLKISEIAIK